jgi:glycosyltransferase involved in cell wall biosynthesis
MILYLYEKKVNCKFIYDKNKIIFLKMNKINNNLDLCKYKYIFFDINNFSLIKNIIHNNKILIYYNIIDYENINLFNYIIPLNYKIYLNLIKNQNITTRILYPIISNENNLFFTDINNLDKIIELDIKIEKINIEYNEGIFDNNFYLEKDKTYIISRNGIEINRLENINQNLYNGLKCFIYELNNNRVNDFCIIIKNDLDRTINLFNLFNEIQFKFNFSIGNNYTNIDDNNLMILYYIYGYIKYNNILNNLKYLNYDNLLKYYKYDLKLESVDGYNENIFKKLISYELGENKKPLEINKINNFIETNKKLFYQKTILIISKDIINYGGNQKVAIQIYKDLLKYHYDVKIFCFTKSRLINEIEMDDVLKINNINELLININSMNYFKIIINKLDEIINYIDKFYVKQKPLIITHNSMDPINKLIIDKSEYIEKVITVNNEHISLLYENGLRTDAGKYINKIDKCVNEIEKRYDFRRRIVYLGRISNEKNVDLLIDGFNLIKNELELELFIIGDGKNINLNNKDLKNIFFCGKLDEDDINNVLITCDYLILPSSTEGMPFCILEAMNIGLPCIASNIIGINEIVISEKTGFLFDLYGYNESKNNISNWDVFKSVDKYNLDNQINLSNTIRSAYNIDIKKWNNLSEKCKNMIYNEYSNENIYKRNIDLILNRSILIIYKNIGQYNDINIDIKEEFEEIDKDKYDMIIKLDDNRFIEGINMYLSKIYLLKSELDDREYNEIGDNNNDFIYFKSNNKNKLNVESIMSYLI